MPRERSGRALALLEGSAVSVTWASSFVLVKLALVQLGPLTIAGLRYFLAFLLLLPLALRANRRPAAGPRPWGQLLLMGLSGYLIGNGAFFWGLRWLPATTAGFVLSFSPLLALLAGLIWLKEVPSRLQLGGTVLMLGGASLFFSTGLAPGEPLGLAIVALGTLSFVLFGLLGRRLAREGSVGTMELAAFPLGLGGGLTLGVALALEGVPQAGLAVWEVVWILALVNTALAYWLYYHALRRLTLLEMNVLLSLSPLITALLGWLLLGETLVGLELLGLAIAVAGATLVQWRPAP